jgi:hypothetical protein
MKGRLIINLAIPLDVDTDHYECDTLSQVVEWLQVNKDEHIPAIVEYTLEENTMTEILTGIEVSNEPV